MPNLEPAGATSSAASPPAGSLQLRPVESGDGEAVHALLAATIPDTLEDRGRWLRRWKWQCWDNPFRQNRPAGWVLLDKQRVVGHIGAVYVPFRTGAETRTAMIVADYAVSPDALAHGGIFAGLQLARTFFESAGRCIPIATTANDKTAAVFTRFGCSAVPWTRELWRAPVTPAQLFRSCRGSSSRVVRGLLRQPGGTLLAQVTGQCFRLVGHRPAIPLPSDSRVEITTPALALDLGPLCQRLLTPPEECTPLAKIGIDRTDEYLAWRYARHPERANIRVIMLRKADGASVAGAVVFCEDRATRRTVFVEDVIAPPDRPDVVRSLLCAALSLALDYRADYLVTTTGREDLRPLFWELGFESRGRSAPAAVIAGPTTAEDAPPRQNILELWHGSMF
ncbi:MAG TPA: hypothetical protein VLM89_16370 [Phycisphaerae bacterium]|nr:hypothetical protein [Phycisphaerae bacterium]